MSAAATVAAVGEEVAYGSGGQLVLGDEPEHRGHGHQLGDVRLAARRGQDRARRSPVRARGELPDQVEAALPVQIDVDEGHVGLQLPNEGQGFGPRGRHTDDGKPLGLEELRSSFEEACGVVDQQTAWRHCPQGATRKLQRHGG